MNDLSHEIQAEQRAAELARIPKTLAVWNRIDALLDGITEHSDPRLKDLKRYEQVMAITVSMAHEITEREYASWDEALTVMERS